MISILSYFVAYATATLVHASSVTNMQDTTQATYNNIALPQWCCLGKTGYVTVISLPGVLSGIA